MTATDHDAYIAAAPEPLRPLLHDLRARLSQALAGAEEVVMYGIPGFQIRGTVVAGYAAFSKQCGLYVDPDVIAAHAGEIAAGGLKATRTGVTFAPGKPIPAKLVEALARSARRAKAPRDL